MAADLHAAPPGDDLRRWSMVCGLHEGASEAPASWADFARLAESRAVAASRGAKLALRRKSFPAMPRDRSATQTLGDSKAVASHVGRGAAPHDVLSTLSRQPTVGLRHQWSHSRPASQSLSRSSSVSLGGRRTSKESLSSASTCSFPGRLDLERVRSVFSRQSSSSSASTRRNSKSSDSSKEPLDDDMPSVRAAKDFLPLLAKALSGSEGLKVAPVPAARKSRGPSLHELAIELHLPFASVKHASEIFERYSHGTEDSELCERKLSMADFSKVLCEICSVESVSALCPGFVSSAFSAADRNKGGDIDIREFLIWYSSASFLEELTLSQDGQKARELARKLGLQAADIDRYKRAFDRFDRDGSGFIDQEEFEVLLGELLRLPQGAADLPRDRVSNLWRMADTDGNGGIDFEEFCMFYTSYFDDRNGAAGKDIIEDFYRKVRRVPTWKT